MSEIGPVRVRRTYTGYVDEYSELYLLPAAPKEVVTAAYRALSLLRHPDNGGSDEAMARLNLAYATIMERLDA